MKKSIKFSIIFFLFLVNQVCALDRTSTGFYYPIGERYFDSAGGYWLSKPPDYFDGYYHIGIDMMTNTHDSNNENSHIYSICDGVVVYLHQDGEDWGVTNGISNFMIAIKHQANDEEPFIAYYGHLQLADGITRGVMVEAGQYIGYTGNWPNGEHLHFGIRLGSSYTPSPWGRMPYSLWTDPCDEGSNCTNGFLNPVVFIEKNVPYNIQQYEADGKAHASWTPKGVPCELAEKHYQATGLPEGGVAPGVITDSSICSEISEQAKIIENAPNPSTEVPDNHWWQSAWRFFKKNFWINNFTETDQIISQMETFGIDFSDIIETRIIQETSNGEIYIISGNGSNLVDATGQGYQSPGIDENPPTGLPDFTEYDLRLLDNDNNERYTYYLYDDEIEMHHWSTNIGEANWAGDADDIYVRFYLSKGYKARNGDDDWVRVGSEEIKKGNLDVGAIKHEWTTLDLHEFYMNGYLEHDGIYNIVVCIDREKDVDNGDGEVPEIHKSNNCTSEAVFIFKESPIPPMERQALITLYDSTNGPEWTNNEGWKTESNPCQWSGVNCEDGHVTKISLSSNNLLGSIPPEIGNLASLTSLDLNLNQLTGSIPPEIGNLASLTSLGLSSNQLSGSIPPEIGNLASLTSLNLSWNQLSGLIPPEIKYLSNLTAVNLMFNNLNGSIPPEIGNLFNLTGIGLQNNQLSGSIPTEIGNLKNLNFLYLDSNYLSGSIPHEIWDLTSLIDLSLGYNQLSGTIPSEIGNFKNLQTLNLDSNQVSGSIPSEIGALYNLMKVNLQCNQLSGSIPSEIGNLTSLIFLNLGGNQLSGSIPPEIGNLTALKELFLWGNQLSGPIPPEIGNLTSLISLYLAWNQLSGFIPPEIGNLTSLTVLHLRSCQLSGSIPPEIGNLTVLKELYLSENQLSGSIPPEIGNLTSLTSLDLRENQLSGSIPSEIGNLTNLSYIELFDNQLSGRVPFSIIFIPAILDGYCNLVGNDPSLCVPNTKEFSDIGLNSICGLPLSSSCNPGNLNKDGNVDLTDAILGLQIIAGQSPSQVFYKEEEINGDGKIGTEDVIYILQMIGGIR